MPATPAIVAGDVYYRWVTATPATVVGDVYYRWVPACVLLLLTCIVGPNFYAVGALRSHTLHMEDECEEIWTDSTIFKDFI